MTSYFLVQVQWNLVILTEKQGDPGLVRHVRANIYLYTDHTIYRAFTQTRDVVAGSLASGLNALLQYVTHFLRAAGVQGKDNNHRTSFILSCFMIGLLCFEVFIVFLVYIQPFKRNETTMPKTDTN